jgi:hypothetical protein
MEGLQHFIESSLGPSVTVRSDAPAAGDVIFLPSDRRGTPGTLNSVILTNLGLPIALPDEKELAAGHCFSRYGDVLVCYIVTVGLLPTDTALPTYLAHALRTSELHSATNIWLPLMGTGAGDLAFEKSFKIILATLRESNWLDRPGRHATISLPGDISEESAQALNMAIEEALDAIAHVPSEQGGSESGAYALAKTPAVDGVLSLAALLGRGREESRWIASSLIFFALCESQGAAAPPALGADAAADLFASAVRELAGDRYDAAWQTYFGARERPDPGPSKSSLPPPTTNVAEILHAAATTARSKGAAAIGIDHLIDALLVQKETGLLRVLEQLALSPNDLLKDYSDARLGQITRKFRNDVASDVDRLGYDGYATAIVDFMTIS